MNNPSVGMVLVADGRSTNQLGGTMQLIRDTSFLFHADLVAGMNGRSFLEIRCKNQDTGEENVLAKSGIGESGNFGIGARAESIRMLSPGKYEWWAEIQGPVRLAKFDAWVQVIDPKKSRVSVNSGRENLSCQLTGVYGETVRANGDFQVKMSGRGSYMKARIDVYNHTLNTTQVGKELEIQDAGGTHFVSPEVYPFQMEDHLYEFKFYCESYGITQLGSSLIIRYL